MTNPTVEPKKSPMEEALDAANAFRLKNAEALAALMLPPCDADSTAGPVAASNPLSAR